MKIPTVRRHWVYDPLLGKVVAERKQWNQSTAIRNGWEHANNHWSVCSLCWRQTEFAQVLPTVRRFRREPDGSFRAVQPPDRARIGRWARRIAERYEQALHGQLGPFAAGQLVVMFCDLREAEGEYRSPEDFYDEVERRLLKRQWAKRAPYPERLYWPAALSELAGEGSSRDKKINQAPYPSAVYCHEHNPNRSSGARRLYQRDRQPGTLSAFREAYEAFRAAVRPGARTLDDISNLRNLAYIATHAKRAHVVQCLVERHGHSLASAGRVLGISRQAASASLVRHLGAECPHEVAALVEDLIARAAERALDHTGE